jgi:hypothetical protein
MDAALALKRDLQSRFKNRVQLTTDRHRPHLQAVDAAFGGEGDCAMLIKHYGSPRPAETRYSPAVCLALVLFARCAP